MIRYFSRGGQGTIESGHNNNLTIDLATVAYWYQDEAVAPARTLKEAEAKPFINHMDMHRWRRVAESKRNDPQLWGMSDHSSFLL